MATPFPFGSGNVLTAAQMNAITTLPTSTKTASHTLTIADLGTRVIMNSASATTITVNTSIFGASDVVEILNIGAGVCTVTAGTCTVGTTGTLALVQNAGGTLTFISASASVFTASGVTASSGALVRVGGGTLSGASTAFTNVFSATYEAYKIVVTGGTLSATAYVQLILGSTTTGYKSAQLASNYTSGVFSAGFATASAYAAVGYSSSDFSGDITVASPQLAKHTHISSSLGFVDATIGGLSTSVLENSTQYTGFTLQTATTFTAGTVNIYGYALS